MTTTCARPAPPSVALTRAPVLRRCGGRQCPPGTCDHDGRLRRDATSRGPRSAPVVVPRVLGMPGEALDPAVRTQLGPRFGHDFNEVRIHTDAQAAASADAVAARAYTVGNHIAFAQAQYSPGTAEGRRLIAHELGHVIQHRGGSGGRSANLRRQVAGAAPATGLRFTAEGVSVLVRSRCAGAGFGLATVETATRDALDKIFNGTCIGPARRRQIQRNLTAHGLDLRCRRSAALGGAGVCAESTGFFQPANIITLGSATFPAHPDVDTVCLPLESTILHEIVHMTRGVFGEQLPRSCEASCYGVGTASSALCLTAVDAPSAADGTAVAKATDADPAAKGGSGIAVGEPDDEEEREAETLAAQVTEVAS
jgi:hypothetical protein